MHEFGGWLVDDEWGMSASSSSAALPNSLPPLRRVRRRLGQDGLSADDDSINVALTLGNGDVERAVEILQEQHGCGDSASAPRRKGKQHANARPGQQENADLQLARRLQAEQTAHQTPTAAGHDEGEAAPVMLAARLCEQLRDAPGLPRGSVVNYDLAVSFLERHARELSRSGRRRQAALGIVYHGTQGGNYRRIMEANLKVPDGQSVLHANDDGYYGRGIYTSPLYAVAQSYAHGGPVFVCLSLPGKMANVGRCDGRPCKPGHDSHSGNNDQEHVFFDSSQLLPCFIAEAASLDAANAAALSAVKLIQRTTASENSVHRDRVLHPTSNSRDAHMHADWDADDDYDEEDDYTEPPW